MIYDVLEFIALALAILIALPVHEFFHAFAAVKNGDDTPKLAGRYTLNPVKHFDPYGLIMLVLVRFGWAKPVPVNPYNFKKRKTGMLLVALAGPLSNLVMAFVSYPLYLLSVKFIPDLLLFDDFISIFFAVFFSLNLSLFLFNLLPIFPLDGFRVVEACSKRENAYMRFMYKYGSYLLLGLMLIHVLADSFYLLSYVDLFGYYMGFTSTWLLRLISAFWGIFF